MKLVRAVIEGYRSIAERMELHLDPAVTVVLGANDHGKSNLLAALTHLNPDRPFDADADLNWDAGEDRSDLPRVEFELALDQQKRSDLLERVNEFPVARADDFVPSDGIVSLEEDHPLEEEDGADGEDEAEEGEDEQTVDREPVVASTLRDIPLTLSVIRSGIDGVFGFVSVPGLPNRPVYEFLLARLPRVELFQPQPTLEDEATWPGLKEEQNEFMRGIFYYAGLDARACGDLFEHTDRTERRLEVASTQLNETLRQSWKQGEDLRFKLSHRNTGGKPTIQLMLHDPAVETTLVRASRRSSGFTHFFKLKTTLHARQQEHPASAYIYLFDEPGVYLHPAGQSDLLRVLEVMGLSNQIVYSTHSLFMINRTYPARHRLVLKSGPGTKLDTKPYVGRWGTALGALGVSVAGTILFADHVLLCEGDSDAIYIPPILQRLVAAGQADVDLNALSASLGYLRVRPRSGKPDSLATTRWKHLGVLAIGNALDADAFIRILLESPSHPALGLLVDGDEGGKSLLKSLAKVLYEPGVRSHQLSAGTSIEDYLPMAEVLYVGAIWRYTAKVASSLLESGPSEEEVRRKVEDSFKSLDAANASKGIADWGAEIFSQITGLGAPSKVGIAREYVQLLEQVPHQDMKAADLRQAKKLLQHIGKVLDLPRLAETSTEILTR